MRASRLLAVLLLAVVAGHRPSGSGTQRDKPPAAANEARGVFLVKPYLQLGHARRRAPCPCSGMPATRTRLGGRVPRWHRPALVNGVDPDRRIAVGSASNRTGFIARSSPASRAAVRSTTG